MNSIAMGARRSPVSAVLRTSGDGVTVGFPSKERAHR